MDVTDFFFTLTPDHILDAVESIGLRSTGRCFALNSLENRVYDIEMEDGSHVVGKFYRPHRWSEEAIREEHEFLSDLAAAEVPAVAPLKQSSGSTYGKTPDGILFAVFPKVRGRAPEELNGDELRQIGRFIGRLHNVGATKPADNRLRLSMENYLSQPLEFLKSGQWFPLDLQSRYVDVCERIKAVIAPLFQNLKTHRIHGDCHLGNLLHNRDGFFFVDFDDMVVGPPVQDLWLVAPGDGEEREAQRESLLQGYTEMREFDRSTLALVEGLRALRIIHYSSWIAKRWKDPAFPRAFPEFNTHNYWAAEIEDLERQLRKIQQDLARRF